MKKLTGGALIFFATLMVDAASADVVPPHDDLWTGKGQIGFVGTQGNTNNKAANAVIDTSLTHNLWKHAFHFGDIYGSNNGIMSADRWDASWQTNYSVTTALFTYGALRYQHDQFSGFHYQASGSVGLGYTVFNTETRKLSAQIGVGYRKSRPQVVVQDAEGAVISRVLEAETNNAVLDAGLDFSQALSKTTMLTDKFTMESGSSNTLYTNTLALAVQMSSKLALSLAYSLQDNTTPPANMKNLDTTETVNLVYGF